MKRTVELRGDSAMLVVALAERTGLSPSAVVTIAVAIAAANHGVFEDTMNWAVERKRAQRATAPTI